jgi:hypothetical protein
MNLKPLLPLILFFSLSLTGQVTEGLVARFTFNNGSGKDELTNTEARFYNALPTTDRFGNEGYAFYLHGNMDSYINLGTSLHLKPVRGTISIWAKVNMITYNGKGGTGNPFIYLKSHAGSDFNEAYAMGYNYEVGDFSAVNSLSEWHQAFVHSDKKISLREWHHSLMTYDDQFLCFYVDGKLQGKVTKGFKTEFLEGDSVLLGMCHDAKNVRFLCGSVDDLEIFDRVLSPKEVYALYNAPNPNRTSILIKWLLVVLGLIALVLASVWAIRRYIARVVKSEKEKDLIKIQWYEHENRTLKAQMNPHFIFNSLNTIQQFIISNENKKAQIYLSKFSRLIRRLLESNTNDRISLKEEIELCEKYMEIESLRFNNAFTYRIHVKETIDPSAIDIPHFLIQVFIENAIWHGLLPKKTGTKQLEILIEVVDEHTVSVIIDDNGVGRSVKPAALQEHKKSLAIGFIKQRLLLFSKMYGREYTVVIIDKLNGQGESEGTKVILTIPIIK